jgi:uncharacterized protein involved in exopolysaccharide biosynthesis
MANTPTTDRAASLRAEIARLRTRIANLTIELQCAHELQRIADVQAAAPTTA